MKKIVIMMVVLIIIIQTFQQSAFGVTTLFIGKSVQDQEISCDYQFNGKYHGRLDTTVINFTTISEMKHIKIDVDYEQGKFIPKNFKDDVTSELWNIQIGYPAINQANGLVYLTIGAINFKETAHRTLSTVPAHKANSVMVGLDLIGTSWDTLQFEINLQRAVGGSTQLESFNLSRIDSAVNLNLLKFKILYIIHDNLALAVRYRWMDCKAYPEGEAVDLKTTSIGVIYRF